MEYPFTYVIPVDFPEYNLTHFVVQIIPESISFKGLDCQVSNAFGLLITTKCPYVFDAQAYFNRNHSLVVSFYTRDVNARQLINLNG